MTLIEDGLADGGCGTVAVCDGDFHVADRCMMEADQPLKSIIAVQASDVLSGWSNMISMIFTRNVMSDPLLLVGCRPCRELSMARLR